jgi:hypothetical protein
MVPWLLIRFGNDVPVVAPRRGVSDTSDPVFYDWWRKKKKEIEDPDEPFVPVDDPVDDPVEAEPSPAIVAIRKNPRAAARLVQAITVPVHSVNELRSLADELKVTERKILLALVAEYEAMQDDEEEALLLLQ